MFCAATFAGYTAYEKATMTNQERLFHANLEALADDVPESTSGQTKCLGVKNECYGDIGGKGLLPKMTLP